MSAITIIDDAIVISKILLLEDAISLDRIYVNDGFALPNRFGLNGLTPYIGDNGNWWIGYDDTGVKAEGYFKSSEFHIDEDGYLVLTYEK
jgi:hypothetical protein